MSTELNVSRIFQREAFRSFQVKSRCWADIVPLLDFAFQPIVNIHTGVCFGYEALLRNTAAAGFPSVGDVFDCAYHEKSLFTLEMLLRNKAVEKFSWLKDSDRYKLFYNIDNRVVEMEDYHQGETSAILDRHGVSRDSLCIEISERHQLLIGEEKKDKLMRHYSDIFKVALDDFGTGYSGLQLLYFAEPDFIKIDRFFINGIHLDAKKKLFVSNIVGMAHVMRIRVIAEGVETEQEFYACKEIGCDLVQGYLIQKPVIAISSLFDKYECVDVLNKKNRRDITQDRDLLYDRIEFISPIINGIDDISAVFERFRQNESFDFLPVVNERYEPLGIIHESVLKEYVYSPFGKELLKNPIFGKPLSDFITPCPVVSVRMKAEKILEIFSFSEKGNGVIVTDDGIYLGYLTSFSLLKVLNEKNIALARDQNPLTRLPGNSRIDAFISETLNDCTSRYIYIYFDFDNFKPFNDRYGFRRGDRAIILFADMLRERMSGDKAFIGHVGGDDFFVGLQCERGFDSQRASSIIDCFRESVKSLYDDEDRERGHIVSTDRDGLYRSFPLMTVSAAVVVSEPGRAAMTAEEVAYRIAELKKKAKQSTEHIASSILSL
jgi:diguanylate cyclase (GGDEF)-like protein